MSGHELPNASSHIPQCDRPIMHARKVVSCTKKNHRPYGCVCGDAFTRLDVLERHIASKNKIAKFQCPLCEHDETVRAFARADHLVQHLRHFHKILAKEIPEVITNLVHHGAAENSILPHQSMTTGDFAYRQPIGLDQNMLSGHHAFQNGISTQQQLSNPAPTWTNWDLQQNAYLPPVMTFDQGVQ